MSNFTIAEDFELPSLGKVYAQEIDPNIRLRSMTTEHELQRLNHGDRPLKIMADIIDDCMDKSNSQLSVYDMCVQDYQFLLHKIRVTTYGPDYKFQTVCPLCGEQELHVLNLDKIECKKFTDECRQYLSFDLPRTQDRISLNVLTPKMMDNIQIKTKEYKSERKTYKGDFEFLVTLMEYIKLVNGESMMEFELEKYIKELPLQDSNYIYNMMQKFLGSFGLNNVITTDCAGCGLTYRSSFRFTNEFYRPTI